MKPFDIGSVKALDALLLVQKLREHEVEGIEHLEGAASDRRTQVALNYAFCVKKCSMTVTLEG